MKKINNLKFKIGLIIGIALIILVGLHNYRKPIPVQKIFNEAIIVKTSNQEILKKTTININANLHKGSILNLNGDSRNKLEGTIVIDDREYVFDGFTQEWDGHIIVAPAQTIEDCRLILDRL